MGLIDRGWSRPWGRLEGRKSTSVSALGQRVLVNCQQASRAVKQQPMMRTRHAESLQHFVLARSVPSRLVSVRTCLVRRVVGVGVGVASRREDVAPLRAASCRYCLSPCG